MQRKGQGLSVTYIVIIALSLIVLVLIAMWFTGSLRFLTERESSIIKGTVSEQTLGIWRNQCEQWCSLGDRTNYENHEFESGDTKTTCTALVETWDEVKCGQ